MILLEKVQGLLSVALKNPNNKNEKIRLINYCEQSDIDFNRSINKAIVITDDYDDRLSDPNNIIIGIIKDDNKGYKLVAWSNRNRRLVTGVFNIKINGKTINNFGKQSWKSWLSYCDEFYLIDANNKSLADTRSTRSSSVKAETRYDRVINAISQFINELRKINPDNYDVIIPNKKLDKAIESNSTYRITFDQEGGLLIQDALVRRQIKSIYIDTLKVDKLIGNTFISFKVNGITGRYTRIYHSTDQYGEKMYVYVIELFINMIK